MVSQLSLNFGVFKTGHNCGTGALTAPEGANFIQGIKKLKWSSAPLQEGYL